MNRLDKGVLIFPAIIFIGMVLICGIAAWLTPKERSVVIMQATVDGATYALTKTTIGD